MIELVALQALGVAGVAALAGGAGDGDGERARGAARAVVAVALGLGLAAAALAWCGAAPSVATRATLEWGAPEWLIFELDLLALARVLTAVALLSVSLSQPWVRQPGRTFGLGAAVAALGTVAATLAGNAVTAGAGLGTLAVGLALLQASAAPGRPVGPRGAAALVAAVGLAIAAAPLARDAVVLGASSGVSAWPGADELARFVPGPAGQGLALGAGCLAVWALAGGWPFEPRALDAEPRATAARIGLAWQIVGPGLALVPAGQALGRLVGSTGAAPALAAWGGWWIVGLAALAARVWWAEGRRLALARAWVVVALAWSLGTLGSSGAAWAAAALALSSLPAAIAWCLVFGPARPGPGPGGLAEGAVVAALAGPAIVASWAIAPTVSGRGELLELRLAVAACVGLAVIGWLRRRAEPVTGAHGPSRASASGPRADGEAPPAASGGALRGAPLWLVCALPILSLSHVWPQTERAVAERAELGDRWQRVFAACPQLARPITLEDARARGCAPAPEPEVAP